MRIQPPFHFDGHGINDANGTRVAKISCLEPYEGSIRNEEFDKLSNMLATAPELVKFAQDIIRYLECGPIQLKRDRNFVIDYAKELLDKAEQPYKPEEV